MIISRTPLRISFFGGGTDLPLFYEKEFGCVLSAAINKHVYLIMHDSFNQKNKLVYSQLEVVDSVEEIKNTRIKEAMKMTHVTNGKEIHSIAEVPAGTGLGSSSSFTVGLLHLLYNSIGKYVSKDELAKQACSIEIDILKEPIGKQDQYAAAYGGFNYIQFNQNGSVDVEPILLSRENIKKLNDRLVLFYLNKKGDASNILAKQNKEVYSNEKKLETVKKIKAITLKMKEEFKSNNIENFGNRLHEVWQLKKSLVEGISDNEIDEIYERGLQAGAVGGKVLGAGGRGFMLFYCKQEDQRKLRNALSHLNELDFEIEYGGTKIVYSQ